MTEEQEAVGVTLNQFVTVGASFTIPVDTQTIGDGQMKMGSLQTPGRYVDGVFETSGANAFTIVCDEPKFMGGEDTAPLPLQYFLAGIAF